MIKETNSEMGLNRTGTKMSPINSEKTIEGAERLTTPPPGTGSQIAENRIRYMKEADSIGSIPFPASIKGMAASIQEKLLTGNLALIDKLGERIAFERTGTRLYEALLCKFHGSSNKKILPDLNRIEQFYLEELKHFQHATQAMLKIGGDPSALTPAADISGTASLGWIQIMSDPRTNFLQSLEIILQAELIDNAGWELLIEIAEKTGLNEMAVGFQQCLNEEEFHLITVKQWVMELTLNNKIVSPEENFTIEIDQDDVGLKH